MVSEDIDSLLHGSSYQAPGGGSLHAPLREKVIAVALEMEGETMTECGVNWFDDHDPFKHVKNRGYMRYMAACNTRDFSFEKWLGKGCFDDFMNVRHIGCVIQSLTLNLILEETCEVSGFNKQTKPVPHRTMVDILNLQ